MTRNRKWECNWQRGKNTKWESQTFDTMDEAKKAAEFWAQMGAWNANWQAETQSATTSPAWTARNGERK